MELYGVLWSIFVLIMLSPAQSESEIPDNVVWTLPAISLWIGHEDVTLPCTFRGAPNAVYWSKGNEDNILIMWYQNIISGPGFNNGAFEMGDDFSLLFNGVQAFDAGRYICRVSNHNLFRISNHTDVIVLDPVDTIAYTKPNITEWKGSAITLPCDFIGEPDKVLWNRQQWYGSSTSVETLLKFAEDTYEVIGDKRFAWSDNYAMVIRDLEIMDESNYTCQVWRPGKELLENGTVVTVNAHAEQPYVGIDQCGDDVQGYEGQVSCLYNITTTQTSFELTCTVSGGKPAVTMFWEADFKNFTLSEKQLSTERSDGSFDRTLQLKVNATILKNKEMFTCTAQGIAVDGTATATIEVQAVEPESGHSPGWQAAIQNREVAIQAREVRMATTISLCNGALVIGIVVVYIFLYRDNRLPNALRFKAFSCLSPHATLERVERDPEAGKLIQMMSPLEEFRHRIQNYTPGAATNTAEIVSPIHIGLFGVIAAGKSSLINSLNIALTGNKNVVNVKHTDQGGSGSVFREIVKLTDNITLIDSKGTKDCDHNQIGELIAQLSGRRGHKPGVEVRGGISVHCPVYVCDFRYDTGDRHATALQFIDNFSKRVMEEYGHHLMVVLTHRDSLQDSNAFTESLHTTADIPNQNIWLFENYTETEDTVKDSNTNKNNEPNEDRGEDKEANPSSGSETLKQSTEAITGEGGEDFKNGKEKQRKKGLPFNLFKRTNEEHTDIQINLAESSINANTNTETVNVRPKQDDKEEFKSTEQSNHPQKNAPGDSAQTHQHNSTSDEMEHKACSTRAESQVANSSGESDSDQPIQEPKHDNADEGNENQQAELDHSHATPPSVLRKLTTRVTQQYHKLRNKDPEYHNDNQNETIEKEASNQRSGVIAMTRYAFRKRETPGMDTEHGEETQRRNEKIEQGQERDLEFLQFIWACLEMAERNITFNKEKKDEIVVESKLSRFRGMLNPLKKS